MPNPELIQESLRLYRRYQLELVEGAVLCPFAKRASDEGAVVPKVSLQAQRDPTPLLTWIRELQSRPQVEVALFICPRLDLERIEFEQFVAQCVRLDAAQRESLESAPFALAAFHPRATADTSRPERLIPYLRRTPDPTVQLVRVSALERVRKGDNDGTTFVDLSQVDWRALRQTAGVSLRQRIARTNLETIQRLGLAEMERRFQDILDDRRRTYDRLGETTHCWEHA